MGKYFDRWEKSHKNWLKVAQFDFKLSLFIAFLIIAVFASIIIGYKGKHSDEPVKLGVSFSVKYAEELGNDWKKNFLALSDELHVERMRLMSYWDRLEPNNNEFNFEELDWQMDQAAARGIDVSLAVGQRQPRWPECHAPGWARELPEEEYQTELKEFIVAVVTRYKDNPALESYQLENEAANSLFGECPPYSAEFLQAEFDLIKKLDPNTDIIINASNQSGVPVSSTVGDRLGFSVYKHAYFEALGQQWKWNYDYVPAWWHTFRAAVVEGFHGIPTFVHELQAEPWGTVATVNLTKEEQDELMNPDQLVEHVDFALATGMREAYLWGGEWWYYRKENFKDKDLWLTARNLFDYYNESSSPR